MTSKRFLTVKELSAKINIKEKTIYAWIGRRVLPFYKIEGLFRFQESEIDEWLSRRHRQEAS
jgi:excisionase family DNA binding protein